jgi:hypothetical protein
MQGYKSALIWLYKEKKIKFNEECDIWLDEFINGYKKIIADKKARGVMSTKEGKSPISFLGYCEICRVMMSLQPEKRKYTWAESLFAWSFMTLSWNLVSRANSVGNVMLQHVDWKEDSMIITFPKHKGDQTGEGLSNDKHVYANPLMPEICPILALAVLVFSIHRGTEIRQQQLFLGKDSESRFSRVFRTVLSLIPPSIDLGATKRDIGTHSNRKGFMM